MKLVNLGCGNKYVVAEEWINVDFNGVTKDVVSHNILSGLPFGNNEVDAIFSSCMLEHFEREEANAFIKECYRCLKPGGVIRIVVPDLEDVCREYLNVLEKVKENDSYKKKYEYIVIELIDQLARMQPGGEMLKYWNAADKDNEYILERTGYPEGETKGKMTLRYLIKGGWNFFANKVFGKFEVYKIYKLGKFMKSGEVHKWMYDSYSLEQLLKEQGFKNVDIKKYNQSRIANWESYGLEINRDGSEYKPHSLYIEGCK